MVSKRNVACAAGVVASALVFGFSLFTILTGSGFEGLLDSPLSVGVAAGVAGMIISIALCSVKPKAAKVKDAPVNSPSVLSKMPKGGVVVDASAVPVLSGRVMNDFADITFQESYVWLKLAEGYQIVKVTEASNAPQETKEDPLKGAFEAC